MNTSFDDMKARIYLFIFSSVFTFCPLSSARERGGFVRRSKINNTHMSEKGATEMCQKEKPSIKEKVDAGVVLPSDKYSSFLSTCVT